MYLFPSKLTKMQIATQTNGKKHTHTHTKIKSFKKNPFPSVLYIALHIQFRPGQERAKCDQIAALNKNTGDFITVFL